MAFISSIITLWNSQLFCSLGWVKIVFYKAFPYPTYYFTGQADHALGSERGQASVHPWWWRHHQCSLLQPQQILALCRHWTIHPDLGTLKFSSNYLLISNTTPATSEVPATWGSWYVIVSIYRGYECSWLSWGKHFMVTCRFYEIVLKIWK